MRMGTETSPAGPPPGSDALRCFQGLLLDRRARLQGQLLRLRDAARRLERRRRGWLAAHVAGSGLSAAGAAAAIVALSLGPLALGASLVASAVGLGVAAAGGAALVASDLSLVVCSAREVRRVREIAASCRDQLRDVLRGLEGVCRRRGRADPRLLQSGRAASAALHSSACFIVLFGSRGFLVPGRAEGATEAGQAVLRAQIQKLAESLESCTGALDELSAQLEARLRLCPGRAATPAALLTRPRAVFLSTAFPSRDPGRKASPRDGPDL